MKDIQYLQRIKFQFKRIEFRELLTIRVSKVLGDDLYEVLTRVTVVKNLQSSMTMSAEYRSKLSAFHR